MVISIALLKLTDIDVSAGLKQCEADDHFLPQPMSGMGLLLLAHRQKPAQKGQKHC